MTNSLCRLYLSLDSDCVVGRSAGALSTVLDAGDIACVLLRSGSGRRTLGELTECVRSMVQARGIAVVLEDDVGLAATVGADGVHLTSLDAYDGARSRLGEDAIVGVDVGNSRHMAMEAGERGAEYVAIPASDEQMVAWWASIFRVPCVAVLGEDSAVARSAVSSGVEFVAIDAGRWPDADAGVAEVARMASLIKEIGCVLA